MSEKNSQIEKSDALYNVIAKLSVVCDFMQTIADPNTCMRMITPNGLGMIMGDCIDTLKKIGGFREQTIDYPGA